MPMPRQAINRVDLRHRISGLASDSGRDIWLTSTSDGRCRYYSVKERDGAGWRKISPTMTARETAVWCHGFERALLSAHVSSVI